MMMMKENAILMVILVATSIRTALAFQGTSTTQRQRLVELRPSFFSATTASRPRRLVVAYKNANTEDEEDGESGTTETVATTTAAATATTTTTIESKSPFAVQELNWQSHVSTKPNATEALEEVLQPLQQAAADDDGDDDHETSSPRSSIAFMFVGAYHASQFSSLVEKASERLSSGSQPQLKLLSVVGGGVIGANQELDEPSKPSLAIMTGQLPTGANVRSFSITGNSGLELLDDDRKDEFWNGIFDELNVIDGNKKVNNKDDDSNADERTTTTAQEQEPASYLIFADPWSPMESVLQRTDSTGGVVAGGISVPTGAGPTVGLGSKALPQGSLVGLRFGSGSSVGVGMQTLVAQGCRPVGAAFRVTKVMETAASTSNVLLELDGQPATKVLEGIIQNAESVEEQRAISSGLLVGLARGSNNNNELVEENDEEDLAVDRDYLIRQIVGFVPKREGVIVGGGKTRLSVGDILRFHVRDSDAAKADLDLMVKRARAEKQFGASLSDGGCTVTTTPFAAVQVSCVARGRNLFGFPNVDLSKVQELTEEGSEIPVAGFYANGELGPVGLAGFSNTDTSSSETHIHGFTTVVALLCEKKKSGMRNDISKPFASVLDGGANNAWE